MTAPKVYRGSTADTRLVEQKKNVQEVREDPNTKGSPEPGTQKYIEARSARAQEIREATPGMTQSDAIRQAGAEIRGVKAPPLISPIKPPTPKGVTREEVESFAEEHGMSPQAATDTIIRFQASPTDPEFAPLTTSEQQSLIRTAKPADQIVQYPDARGQTVIVSTDAVKKLDKLGGEAKFDAMKSLRILPRGAVYIPGREGVNYLTEDKADELRKSSPLLYNVLLTVGVEAAEREGVRLKRVATAKALKPYTDKQGNIDFAAAANAIRLGKTKVRTALIGAGYEASDINQAVKQSKDNIFIGGMIMPIKDWNTIPEVYQNIALKANNFDAMDKAWEADIKKFETTLKTDHPKLFTLYKTKGVAAYNTEVDRLKVEYDKNIAAVTTLKGTKHYTPEEVLPPGMFGPPIPEAYNLVGAMKEGYIKEVRILFPEEAIKEAQSIIREEEKAATLDVARYKREQLWRNTHTMEVVTATERKAIIAKKPADKDKFVKEQPALVLAVDPKWVNDLRDRPESDPERQVYKEQWKKKIVDTAMYASLFATPYIPGAFGAVATRVLGPAFSGAIKAASFITTGGTALAKSPIISAIPRFASQVIVGLG